LQPKNSQQGPKQMNKRLIEYDLPLADISEESARERSIRHGHPSTLHIWWARGCCENCPENMRGK
jgi:hypothetical protein